MNAKVRKETSNYISSLEDIKQNIERMLDEDVEQVYE